MKRSRLIVVILIIFFGNYISSQGQVVQTAENFNLRAKESGNKVYAAREVIRLSEGFSYKADNSNSFKAKIDPTLIFVPENNIYADINGNIVSDYSKGAVVGNFSGDLQVSQTGAATYSIPIECPEGVGGMKPSISLNYSSQAGPGIAGMSWSLSGLSMITRSPKNYYFDEERSNIIWDESSPLALDGQRLIEINRWQNDSIEYRTESGLDIIVGYKIISGSGPTSFKVYSKEGKILIYEKNPDDFVGYSIKTINKGSVWEYFNLGWVLTRVIDSHNNCIEFKYKAQQWKKENTTTYYYGDHNISKIVYGHLKGNTLEETGSIHFDYKTKSSGIQYVSGIETKNQQILNKIQVKGMNNILLDTYELSYDSLRSNYFLKEVKRKNSTGEFIHPLRFQWTDEEYLISTEKIPINYTSLESYKEWRIQKNYSLERKEKLYGDLNGDGIMDLVMKLTYSNGKDEKCFWAAFVKYEYTSTYKPIYEQEWNKDQEVHFLLFDHDRDGKDELYILRYLQHKVNGIVYYSMASIDKYFYTGSAMEEDSGFLGTTFVELHTYNNRAQSYLLVGDFKGNAKNEFLLVANKNSVYSFDTNTYGILNIGGNDNSRIYLSDINGNGKTEIMYIHDNQTTFYEYNKDSDKYESICTSNSFNYDADIYPADFNVDGTTDFLVRDKTVNKVWLSTGDTLVESSWETITDRNSGIIYPLPWGGSGSAKLKPEKILMDINQDGRIDVISSCNFIDYSQEQVLRTNVKMYINNGNGFDEVFNNNYSCDTIFSVIQPGKFIGLSDKAVLANKHINLPDVPIFRISPGVKFNKIVSITDALGEKKTIVYGPVKTPVKQNANIKLRDGKYEVTSGLLSGIEVVTTIRGTLQNEAYLFEDPQFHWEGRGFLGFASTRVTDWINREYKKSKSNRDNTFHFLYPYKNSVEEMTNRIIHETTNYYRVIQGKNKRFELCLDSVSARDVLKNMSVKTTYSKYDTDRNPLSVKIDYGDGISITETYEYVSKASRFKNKLVSHTILQEAKNEKSITRTKKYSYDEKGNLIEEIADSQDNSSDIKENKRVWKYYKRYDEYGNPGSIITDASGIQHTKTFTYTSYGRFIQQETDSRIPGEISYTYDNARGLLKSKKDRYGTTSYEYDNFGTLKLTTYPDGIKTASVLRWAGNEPRPSGAVFFNHAETSGKGPMRIWYDKLGRELQTESYGLNSKKVLVDTKYNSQGRIQYVSEPYFQGSSTTQGATYVYDIYGRVSKLTTAMGTTNYSYSGRTTEITTPTGKKKTTVNAAGWVTEEKTNDKTVTFTHYANGAVKTATPQGGNSVAMKYDIQGNRTELNDPDAGTVFSKYNAWGQLIEEKQSVHNSSSSVITSHFYLDNGLLDYKDQNGIKTRYEYDSNNRVKKISMDQISQEFAYDSFDRIVSVKDNLGSGKVFTKTMEYDQLGRIEKEIYPSNYWISKRYDKYSLLTEITDQKGQKIWKAIEANAKGQLTKTQAGNKETVYTYNEKDFPIGIKTPGIVDMTYTFDGKWNNLNSRKDNLTGFEEVFTYDDLDRLQTWSVMGPNGVQAKWEQKYEADKTTITSKTAYGKDFKYGIGNIKPHALTSVVPETGTNFSADQTITYTDFKKMKTIKSGAYDLAVTYSVDQERIKTVLTKDKKNFTRYYLGNYEEEINSSGNVRKIHYINGGNGLAAAYIANQNGKDSLYYIHMDYQGSLIALSLPEGTVKEKYAYDPWGKRRNPANWSQIDKRTGFIVNRGYTMHEHLPEFNLINMNGRVYDPGAGLFFSPDPFIQAPDNWLNYNRYSYCMNNPLKYADPSGEFLISAIGLGIFMNIVTQDISNFKDFLFAAGIGALSGAAGYWGGSTVAGAIFQGGFVGGASIGIASGTVGSFVSGAGNSWMNGANFAQGLGAGLISGAKSGVTGAVTAGITRGLSDMINGYDFWDGTQINELSTGEFGVYERAGKAYNESWLAEYKDENLLNRIYEVYGVTPRNMKIEALTTKTTKGYGLTTEGKYIKPNGAISKGFTLHSSTGKVSVHISPFYAEGDIVHFRAVTGHELIHAYHYIKFHGNNFIREHSESVAYRYTYNVYNKAGYYSDALDTMNSAVKNGFWEVYRSEYMSMPHRTNFFKK